jgi:hypothetical protein
MFVDLRGWKQSPYSSDDILTYKDWVTIRKNASKIRIVLDEDSELLVEDSKTSKKTPVKEKTTTCENEADSVSSSGPKKKKSSGTKQKMSKKCTPSVTVETKNSTLLSKSDD